DPWPPGPSTCRFCTLLCGSRVAAAALFEEVFQMFQMLALACAFALSAGPVLAQQPAAPAPSAATLPYRPPITLDQAKRAMAAGGAGMRLLGLKNITPIEGGLPMIVDGKIIGAIGVSGSLSSQDAQVAKAGPDALAR